MRITAPMPGARGLRTSGSKFHELGAAAECQRSAGLLTRTQ